MAGTVKLRGKISDGVGRIKSLIPHPMETCTRRDEAGNLIPAHHIETVTCYKNGNQVLKAEWGAAVSKNPFFEFKVKNCVPGDVIRMEWTDNLGERGSGELVLK